MKTNFRKCFSVLAIAAMVSTVTLMSCKKSSSEVTPVPEETTEDTIEKVYYITGIVTTSSGVLSGATVTSGSVSDTTDSDGVYSLKMSSKSTASVKFSMDGYITIDATAIFASGATVGDAVTLSQQLTATATAIPVTAGTEAELSFDHDDSESDIVVLVPAEALKEDVSISATYFTPAATTTAAVALASVSESESGGTTEVTSSISAVYLEPSGTEFITPVTISIPGEEIEGAYHAKMIDGEWVEQTKYDIEYSDGAYKIKVDGFSQHSIAVDSTVSVSSGSSSTVDLKSEVFDNIGKVSVSSGTVSYSQYSGWELSNSTSSTISSFVAGLMGTSEGVSKISKSLDVVIAGDEKVTVTIKQAVVTTTYTLGTTSVSATSYGDVTVSVETEQGDLRPDHNN